MIGIVTLNPCVDKTLFLPALPAQGVHTARKVTHIAGGNGNNIARVLGALGAPNRSLVMTAGPTGAHIRALMAVRKILYLIDSRLSLPQPVSS